MTGSQDKLRLIGIRSIAKGALTELQRKQRSDQVRIPDMQQAALRIRDDDKFDQIPEKMQQKLHAAIESAAGDDETERKRSELFEALNAIAQIDLGNDLSEVDITTLSELDKLGIEYELVKGEGDKAHKIQIEHDINRFLDDTYCLGGEAVLDRISGDLENFLDLIRTIKIASKGSQDIDDFAEKALKLFQSDPYHIRRIHRDSLKAMTDEQRDSFLDSFLNRKDFNILSAQLLADTFNMLKPGTAGYKVLSAYSQRHGADLVLNRLKNYINYKVENNRLSQLSQKIFPLIVKGAKYETQKKVSEEKQIFHKLSQFITESKKANLVKSFDKVLTKYK